MPEKSNIHFDAEPIVLVIDDEHEILEETRIALIRQGYACVTSNSALKGLDILKKSARISLVLCDIKMPHTNGLEFISLAKKQIGPGRVIRFAVITGHPSLDVAISCLRLGVSDFIAKPIRHKELFSSLEQMKSEVNLLSAQLNPHTSISEENLKKIWHGLDELSSHLRLLVCESPLENDAAPVSKRSGDAAESLITADTVEALLKVRAVRHLYFNADLFNDPAWDMLLDLMLAKLRSQKVPVTALCATSGTPIATAHRRIQLLEKSGLISRCRDDADSRRVLVALTPEGESKMRSYLERAFNKQLPV